MNFIFISPNFPKSYWNFCNRLKRNGVNVLGIGDAAYDELPFSLKDSLTEYYHVESLACYDEMVRAVGYFTFRYGRIDWLESNNEYWLAQDACLRTDFNITTGARNDFIRRIKNKSAMKECYRAANVPVARWHMVTADKAATEAFIRQVGFPVIVKPDSGCGAEATYRLSSQADLDRFHEKLPAMPYIMEEFITGTIVSFDGIAGPDCVPLFCTSNVFPTPILDIVEQNGDLSYWTVPEIDPALREIGFRTIKAFGTANRFFHCEFFRLTRSKKGLGHVGDYVALEVNMRPAGGYTPDMINYANSVDCYQIWADMVTTGRLLQPLDGPHSYCVYAARRDGKQYAHTHAQILSKYAGALKMADRMPEALALDMGNQMYTACFTDDLERKKFIRYVQQPAPTVPPKEKPPCGGPHRQHPHKRKSTAKRSRK